MELLQEDIQVQQQISYGSGTTNTTNDILGFALDMDNNKLYVQKMERI